MLFTKVVNFFHKAFNLSQAKKIALLSSIHSSIILLQGIKNSVFNKQCHKKDMIITFSICYFKIIFTVPIKIVVFVM